MFETTLLGNPIKLFRLVSEFECEVAHGDMALIDNALLVSWELKD